MGFGYKTAWIAARTADTDGLIRALRLRNAKPCEAEDGIDASYIMDYADDRCQAFVTQPIDGWTLCVSVGFFRLVDGQSAAFGDLIVRLSNELGCEVQFFGTHRVVEGHAWARAINGTLRRAYSYVGESGETEIDFGEQTPEEVTLEFAFFDASKPEAEEEGYWDREDRRYPDEEDVMSLAELWSVNPSTLGPMPPGLLADMGSDAAQSHSSAAEPTRADKP